MNSNEPSSSSSLTKEQLLHQAIAHQEAGRLLDAAHCYLALVEANPDCGKGRHDLDAFDVSRRTGTTAMPRRARLRRTRTQRPPNPSALEAGNLVDLFNEGRYSDAAALAQLLTLRFPAHGLGWKVLGAAYKQLGRSADAVIPMQKAATLSPLDADAHSNLGAALRDLGRLDEAEASCRRALEVDPRRPGAHLNLGNILKELGRLDEAEATYRRALEIKPDYAEAHNSLGNVLRDWGRLQEAEASYRRAVEIKPAYTRARVSLLMLTVPIAPRTLADSQTAAGNFARTLTGLEEWIGSLNHRTEEFQKTVSASHPFYLAYRGGNHLDLLSRYGDLANETIRQPIGSPCPVGSPGRRLKLVVVSGHFRRHSVWDINLRGLLEHIDRRKFEVVLYHVGLDEDDQTEFARSCADSWRDSHTTSGFNAWAQAMIADRADVIFYPEVGMDPTALRLANCRFAPIQAASWGHPITTGLPTIDLFFSGELLEPLDADSQYRERLLRLPGTGCCTTPIDVVTEELTEFGATIASRPGPRFLMAQMPFKFDPSDDHLYAKIAATVGDSSFILLRSPKVPWATDIVVSRLSQAFREHGLVPEEHLVVLPWLSRGQFWSLLDSTDVYLDCPSFSGYTTAWQALHRGLPVLTLEGEFMRQRLASAILRRMGVTDTIASSRDEYVAIAARLADECRDSDSRHARREANRRKAPQVDNDVGVVRAFEQKLIAALAEKGLCALAGNTGV